MPGFERKDSQTATHPPLVWHMLSRLGLLPLLLVVMGLCFHTSRTPAGWWLPSLWVMGIGGAAAVVAGVAMAARCTAGQPVWVRLDRRGVRLGRYLRRSERLAWDEIHDVAWSEAGATLATARGDRLIPAALCGWRGVAVAIEARLRHAASAEGPWLVSTRNVREWLGQPKVACPMAPEFVPLLTGLLTAGYLMLMALAMGGTKGEPLIQWLARALGFAFAAAVAQAALAWALSGHSCIEASQGGLNGLAGHRVTQSCGWDECLAVEERGWYWDIETTRGCFRLPRSRPEAERIVDVVRKVLEAREATAAAPRLGALSSASLSRASVAVAADLGLSGAEAESH